VGGEQGDTRTERAALAARLRERLPELEEKAVAAARAGCGGRAEEGPEILLAVRGGIAEGLTYALEGLQGDPFRALPLSVLKLVRRAARVGLGLDSVLRLCAAGERVVGEAILEESPNFPLATLREALQEFGLWSDRWMAEVSEEFDRELGQWRQSPAGMAAEQVNRLLAGELDLPPDELSYRFNGWHLGVIAWGGDPKEALRGIAARFDQTLLTVPRGEDVVWGWLGGRRPLAVQAVEQVAASLLPDEVLLAVGEPHQGIAGWRQTHREAQVASGVMLRRPEQIIRSSSVALLAALLRDQVLANLVKETFLRPLEADNSGEGLCRTVQTYMEYGFNASSTSAALDIDRSTVQRHLHKVEQRLGRHLNSCHAELKVALELKALEHAKF
jgi:hypothetical protein